MRSQAQQARNRALRDCRIDRVSASSQFLKKAEVVPGVSKHDERVVEQMDEARREDDSSSKVFADEEAPAEERIRQGLGEEDGEEDSNERGDQKDTGKASGSQVSFTCV